MNQHKGIKLTVDGHTDNVGSAMDNQKLSERRAVSVKNYLLEKGIDAKRIITNGFGLPRPIADNSTIEGREKDRRVEFKMSEM